MNRTETPAATTFSTPSDREIVMTRAFDAPRKLVFGAWADPAHLPQWMLGPPGWTMTACEIDPRPGGAWRLGWRSDEGAEMGIAGVYREVDHPGRIVTTESWGGDWPETLNTMDFAEEGGTTTMTHTILYPSKEARDAALGTGMKEGVAQSYDRLETYLRSLT